MDSIKAKDGPGMAAWKATLGGSLFEGYLKLTVLLVTYLLVGGLTLAQWARAMGHVPDPGEVRRTVSSPSIVPSSPTEIETR